MLQHMENQQEQFQTILLEMSMQQQKTQSYTLLELLKNSN